MPRKTKEQKDLKNKENNVKTFIIYLNLFCI